MSTYKTPIALANSFLGLKPHPTKCQATYVWIDGTGEYPRSKMRVLPEPPESIEDYPIWNFDGSSTGQASGNDSDVFLHPVADFPDPFLGGHNKLVLCDTYDSNNQPTATNHRNKCLKIMKKCELHKPWFGMEQEYFFLDNENRPLGWPRNGFPAPQGPYYCAESADRVFGSDVVETHVRACLHANINISGTNAEVAPSQWEFQIGPCEGITMGDQLWMARYLLNRTARAFGVVVTLDPKPFFIKGNWNGSGCHTNFSTVETRKPGGIRIIEAAMTRLEARHTEHLRVYDPNGGLDNIKRLSGLHEASTVGRFTWGIANRNCSVRIPRQVSKDGCGYFEDRRPASNCDPYSVTATIAETVLL